MHIGILKYLPGLFRLRNCKFLKHVIPNVRVLYKKKIEQVNRKGNNASQQQTMRALTMQDFISESKTINYILFMVFC